VVPRKAKIITETWICRADKGSSCKTLVEVVFLPCGVELKAGLGLKK